MQTHPGIGTQNTVFFPKIEQKPCLLVKLATALKCQKQLLLHVRHFGLGGRESFETAVISSITE